MSSSYSILLTNFTGRIYGGIDGLINDCGNGKTKGATLLLCVYLLAESLADDKS